MKPLTQEQKIMVEKNSGLCHVVLKRLPKKFVDEYGPDDILQESKISLIKACQSYNPQKGTKFSTYAVCCMMRDVSHLMIHCNRKCRKKPFEISLDKKADDISRGTLSEAIADEEDIENDVLTKNKYQWVINSLVSDKKEFLIPFLRNEMSASELAKCMGVTKSTIHNWKSDTIYQIRKRFSEDEWTEERE